jgi:serine/threonine protein kinase/Tol biopolymer transport system component
MTLDRGTKLGPYEILEPLGAGGMGEVYKGRDARLNREVAIKVCGAQFSERFEREARAIGALNHPHICSIYDVGPDYLVLELVDGPTLGAKIAAGRIPVEEALAIARQIAEALEAAHEKGIVHRDLKPANVKITPEGSVKVLDFGLAKAAEEPGPATDPSISPTLTMAATQAGVILGTAAYMSPEQARGATVDRRSDIWSFGVVLFEMLAGKHAFSGESVSDILAAILRGEPDWAALPPDTPPRIRKLLRRCLERDRKQRLQAIGEARITIDAPEESVPAETARWKWWPWAAATAVLAIAAAAGWWRRPQPEAHPLMKLSVELGPDLSFARTSNGGGLAISPDGSRVAFRVRDTDGKVRLGTRRLDRSEITIIPGSEGATSPFFSPNSQWIAFTTPGKLNKVAAQGGTPVAICDVAIAFLGGSWGDDDNIIATVGLTQGLVKISSAGGAPTQLTKLRKEKSEFRHSWPQVLPGSQAVLFTAYIGGPFEPSLEVLSLKTGERKPIHAGFFGRYLPSGHLVYIEQNTLFAAPFSLSRLEMTGTPQPVLENINSSFDAGAAFDVSQNGIVAYVGGQGESEQAIFWLDATGKTRPLYRGAGIRGYPRFSPDGKRLAFSMVDGQGHQDVWIHDLERDTTARVTFTTGPNLFPMWTQDGRNILYTCDSPAAPGIYSVRADGGGEARLLTDGKVREVASSFTPDGKRLAFFGPTLGGDVNMWTAPFEGGAEQRLGPLDPILRSRFLNILPVFSPDGRWLAYVSNESVTREVYVRPFPGPGGARQISSGGGWFPVWSPKGRELFFRGSDSRIMVVSYAASGDSFVPGKPRVWSDHRTLDLVSPPIPSYDLAPDGKRFAVVLYPDGTADQKPITHLTVLLNFFDELRRRVPSDGR